MVCVPHLKGEMWGTRQAFPSPFLYGPLHGLGLVPEAAGRASR